MTQLYFKKSSPSQTNTRTLYFFQEKTLQTRKEASRFGLCDGLQGPSRRMFEEPSPETFGVATLLPLIVPKCASRLQSSGALRTASGTSAKKDPFLLLPRF